MKANELRIGNWVETNEGYKRVAELDKYGISYHITPDAVKLELCKYIKPIPLTEEWLLKCGFRKLDKYTFVKNKWFVYKRKRGFVTASKKREVKLDYVHLLQNWYYFNTNGEELELQL